MSLNPQIVIDVSGESAGSPGVARSFSYSKVSPTPPTVTLSLASTSGITSFYWEILDQPTGASATLSDQTAASPTFTPTADIPGTYLIQCIVNAGAAYARNGIAFLTSVKSFRLPAAGESREFDANDGWKNALNTALLDLDGAANAVIGDSIHWNDDFVISPGDHTGWTVDIDGAGHVQLAQSDEIESGPGILDLYIDSYGDNVTVVDANSGIIPENYPIMRARVWLAFADDDRTNAVFEIGFVGFEGSPSGPAVKFMHGDLGVDGWSTMVKSVVGGGFSGTENVTPAAHGQWYDLRIELIPGVSVKFYVDDVLVNTVTAANAVPVSGDYLTREMYLYASENEPSHVYVDYFCVELIRV